jgi:hypothetical protein
VSATTPLRHRHRRAARFFEQPRGRAAPHPPSAAGPSVAGGARTAMRTIADVGQPARSVRTPDASTAQAVASRSPERA